jgi:exonuclease VII small subunit
MAEKTHGETGTLTERSIEEYQESRRMIHRCRRVLNKATGQHLLCLRHRKLVRNGAYL